MEAADWRGDDGSVLLLLTLHAFPEPDLRTNVIYQKPEFKLVKLGETFISVGLGIEMKLFEDIKFPKL